MLISLDNVTKYYGTAKAVDNISFAAHSGQVTGLIGPNGAGKTTTLRLITGFLRPSQGSVKVHGMDVTENLLEIRRLIGYLPEENPLYPDVEVVDHLEFVAALQGVPQREIPRRVREVVELFGLQDIRYDDIGTLSRGLRQRVGLAQSMVHDPPILLLDEPMQGLDPNQVVEFRRFITELSIEKTVIFSSHNLAEVQALCNRVIILNGGRSLSDSSLANLQKEFLGSQQLFVAVDIHDQTLGKAAEGALRELASIERVTPLDPGTDDSAVKTFYIEARKESSVVKELFDLCGTQGWTLVDVKERRAKIEDIFRRITGRIN
jgi:ABC-2 type transport system ATP-binding protein